MKIDLTVSVSEPVYSVYFKAAQALGDRTVAQVMSEALEAYVQDVIADMLKNGDLSDTQV